MENRPLLSICIPTYNRADVLRNCLDSIVYNKDFSQDVEIVVSDNSENDDTKDVVCGYLIKYNNIRYFKNRTNVGAETNFILSLKRGTGYFLKLHNDYSCFTDTGLSCLIEVVKKYDGKGDLLLFRNVTSDSLSEGSFNIMKLDSFDELVKKMGSDLSWIGNYGFWYEDINSWDDLDRRKDTLFMQVDWLIRGYKKYNSVVLVETHLTNRYPFKSKQGGYNYIKVHTENFLSQFKECVDDGILSKHSFVMLKRSLLPSILFWIYMIKFKKDERFTYSAEHCYRILWKQYKQYPWAYWDVFQILSKSLIRKVLSYLS